MEVLFMKIKTASELTGLTIRAIRVYIDEQLIAPQYTENYLGRRLFEFSPEDIDNLKNIATLRKYGFAIDEIRSILSDSQNSISIIENVKARTQSKMDEYRERLNALSLIEDNKAYSFCELSDALSQSETKLEMPAEHTHKNYRKIIGKTIKGIAVFAAVWLPFVLALKGLLSNINEYSYPKIDSFFVVLTVLSLMPSVAILVITKIKPNVKRAIKLILIFMCILSMPISFIAPFGIVTDSETTDFRDYRDLDPGCLANRSTLFGELFPTWPHYFENVRDDDGNIHTVYLDAKYYYHFTESFDSAFDIYAEWPLQDEKFTLELQRVEKIFEEVEKSVENSRHYKFVKMKHGEFSCYILYDGEKPFQAESDSYDYIIFACNEEKNIVRYIYCYSLRNGIDQPYYLQLDW